MSNLSLKVSALTVLVAAAGSGLVTLLVGTSPLDRLLGLGLSLAAGMWVPVLIDELRK